MLAQFLDCLQQYSVSLHWLKAKGIYVDNIVRRVLRNVLFGAGFVHSPFSVIVPYQRCLKDCWDENVRK